MTDDTYKADRDHALAQSMEFLDGLGIGEIMLIFARQALRDAYHDGYMAGIKSEREAGNE